MIQDATPPPRRVALRDQHPIPSRSPWLRATCLAAALTMGAGTETHGTPPARPPAGTDVDETRTVAQRTRAPADCLSVVQEGVTVLLDRSELSRQAHAKPTQWKTEAERMALIDGRRAAALLQAAAPARGGGPACHQVTQTLDGEDQFVVLAHLERGAAAVLPAGATQPVPSVAIRYLGQRCGPLCGRGSIMVSIPGQQRPFMVTHWWAS
ncbi:hypothetical protein [Acidovorax sp. A1169]|uniref:hypothetical protein n=1 Tax=Acidovorax sp. A1169 TaxID=3059524 RepID=UPI002737DE9A|nr:hypothetical protein [Acidovorax sp. A1169]MDP4076947.1 hypothetical protein [Acidovorax sp. A1169]